MDYDFSNKVVLITGGASGIGLACAKELLHQQCKGILIVDVNTETGNQAVKTLGEKSLFSKADVTDEKQFEDAFKTAIDKFGRLDIVINNAGLLNENNWKLAVQLNINAVITGTELGFKYMGKNHGGNGGIIINVSSVHGFQASAVVPVYTGSKYFVIGYGRSLGTEFYYNLTGVKILTLCPGLTETNLWNTFQFSDKFSGIREYADTIVAKITLQKVENVSKGLLKIIDEGENGSSWLADGNKPAYEIPTQIPTLK